MISTSPPMYQTCAEAQRVAETTPCAGEVPVGNKTKSRRGVGGNNAKCRPSAGGEHEVPTRCWREQRKVPAGGQQNKMPADEEPMGNKTKCRRWWSGEVSVQANITPKPCVSSMLLLPGAPPAMAPALRVVPQNTSPALRLFPGQFPGSSRCSPTLPRTLRRHFVFPKRLPSTSPARAASSRRVIEERAPGSRNGARDAESNAYPDQVWQPSTSHDI